MVIVNPIDVGIILSNEANEYMHLIMLNVSKLFVNRFLSEKELKKINKDVILLIIELEEICTEYTSDLIGKYLGKMIMDHQQKAVEEEKYEIAQNIMLCFEL